MSIQNNYKILFFDINEDEVNLCKPLAPENYNPTDCTVNVMDFLKIIDKDVANNLSKLTNLTNMGTNISEIKQFLSYKYKSYNFISSQIFDIDENKNNLDIIGKNQAIIALFASFKKIDGVKKYLIGHAVLIARDIKNQLFIIDRQSNKQINITDINNLINYMKEYNFQEIHTILFNLKSPKKIKIPRRLLETNITLRKQKESENKQKKQKIEQEFKRYNPKRKRSKRSLPNENKIVLRKIKHNETAKIKRIRQNSKNN